MNTDVVFFRRTRAQRPAEGGAGAPGAPTPGYATAGGNSVAFCRHCTEFICEDCVRCHRRMKVFSGQVVASLEDLKKGGNTNIPLKEATPNKCTDHDKSIQMFCFDRDRLICRDCTIIDHSGHNFNSLKKCAPESRKKLGDSLVPLKRFQLILQVLRKQ